MTETQPPKESGVSKEAKEDLRTRTLSLFQQALLTLDSLILEHKDNPDVQGASFSHLQAVVDELNPYELEESDIKEIVLTRRSVSPKDRENIKRDLGEDSGVQIVLAMSDDRKVTLRMYGGLRSFDPGLEMRDSQAKSLTGKGGHAQRTIEIKSKPTYLNINTEINGIQTDVWLLVAERGKAFVNVFSLVASNLKLTSPLYFDRTKKTAREKVAFEMRMAVEEWDKIRDKITITNSPGIYNYIEPS